MESEENISQNGMDKNYISRLCDEIVDVYNHPSINDDFSIMSESDALLLIKRLKKLRRTNRKLMRVMKDAMNQPDKNKLLTTKDIIQRLKYKQHDNKRRN
jgi:hypothetical protein